MRPCAGVDGCRAGWVAVIRDGAGHRAEVFSRFEQLVDHLPQDALIAVDMPIGLPDAPSGGRPADLAAKAALPARFKSSIFPIPSREAVYAVEETPIGMAAMLEAHAQASKVARATSDPPKGLSIQAFMILPKVREIDRLLRQREALRERVIESHPELAFWRANGCLSLARGKKRKGKVQREGMAERRALLVGRGIPDAALAAPPSGAGEDDLLDAAMMLLVAEKHVRGEAVPLPDPIGRDGQDIPIVIWS